MPTGYTAQIVDKGIGFKEFAMICARAFGACIEMRDDPMGAPIPEKFEPSDYHTKALASARQELQQLQAMGEDAKIHFGNNQIAAERETLSRMLAKDKLENERLMAVEADVNAWTPPSPDHKELKEFMLQQISLSKHDPASWTKELAELDNTDPLKFWQKAVNEAEWNINCHTENANNEIKRAESRTRWIQQLRESLK